MFKLKCTTEFVALKGVKKLKKAFTYSLCFDLDHQVRGREATSIEETRKFILFVE